MNDDPIDLEWTGWRLGEERERELVERIVAAARIGLDRRADAADRVDLARWMRPVLAAAAVVAALSVATLGRVERATPATGAATTGDALELPAPVTEWIARDTAPGISEWMVVMAEGEE